MKPDALLRRIERAGQLPTLPRVAAEVMDAVRSPDSSMAGIAEVISRDPALAAKVLKAANSAFYGLREQVGSLQLALSILGMREINSLVLSLSVFRVFPRGAEEGGWERDLFWKHSAAAGQVARLLCAQLDLPMQEEAFVAGLLHDMGKIVIDQYSHDQFKEIVATVRHSGVPMIEAEAQVMGITHEQIGGDLAERWHLPEGLVESIRRHHNPAAADARHAPLAAVVHLSDRLCNLKGCGFGGDMRGAVLEDSPAWRILEAVRPQIGEMDLERFTFELDDQIDRALELVGIAMGETAEREDPSCL